MCSDMTALDPIQLAVSCPSAVSFIHMRQMCRFFTLRLSYDLPFSGALNVAPATASAGVCYAEHWEAWRNELRGEVLPRSIWNWHTHARARTHELLLVVFFQRTRSILKNLRWLMSFGCCWIMLPRTNVMVHAFRNCYEHKCRPRAVRSVKFVGPTRCFQEGRPVFLPTKETPIQKSGSGQEVSFFDACVRGKPYISIQVQSLFMLC